MRFDWRLTWTVFRRELRDSLRDRTILFVNYVFPFLLYPGLVILMGEAALVHFDRVKREERSFLVLGDRLGQVPAYLSRQRGLKTAEVPSVLVARLDAMVRAHEAIGPSPVVREGTPLDVDLRETLGVAGLDALVYIQDLPARGRDTASSRRALVYYQLTESRSKRAAEQIEELLKRVAIEERDARLSARGMSPAFIAPLTVRTSNLAGIVRSAIKLGGGVLPYVILVYLCIGTFYPALHGVVGEKEKGVLVAVLASGARVRELLLGKYLNILLSGIATVTAHAASAASVLLLFPKAREHVAQYHPGVSIILIILASAVFVAALCLAAATLARTTREGQNFLSILMMGLILPQVVAPMADLRLDYLVALVPVLNASVGIPAALVDPIPVGLVALILLSNLVFAAMLFLFTEHQFTQNTLLFRGEAGLVDLLNFNRNALREPVPALSLMLFVFAVLPVTFISGSIQNLGVYVVAPLIQIGCITGIPLLVARYFRLDLRRSFQLARPSTTAVWAGIVVGLASPFVSLMLSRVVPPPEGFSEDFARALGLGGEVDPFVAILLFAVLPGICEELTYRGILLRGFLNRLSPAWAIGLSALFFGLSHFSTFRFLPTAAMGAVLSYLAWKTRSIWPGVVAHAIHNGLAIGLGKALGGGAGAIAWRDGAVGVVCVAAGLWLARRDAAREQAEPARARAA